MIKIGKNCDIGNLKLVRNYEEIIIGDNVTIGNNVRINVKNLKIGDRSVIGEGFIIEGNNIDIGKEFYSDRDCTIGGGSCNERLSYLKIGDLCYMGTRAFINTARAITIGNEVGLGADTKLLTHGAYLNYLEGYPVQFGSIKIGNNVWIPQATILPNVEIGNDVIIAAMSLLNKNLPNGCLAGGVPCKIIKDNYYPVKLTDKEIENKIDELVTHFMTDIIGYTNGPKRIIVDGGNHKRIYIDSTLFDFEIMRIDGPATEFCEKFRQECRRFGIRFKYYPDEKIGIYKS